jgi:hypothetical protein
VGRCFRFRFGGMLSEDMVAEVVGHFRITADLDDGVLPVGRNKSENVSKFTNL